jgi:methylenetetrahydrofolate dehydrogenase (NADP+)/methenyltetrahydrofolate cyclohydrolase
MSQAAIIDGKAFAATLRARVAEYAATFEQSAGRKAGLAVVLVGEDPASKVYVASKGKATVECGMASFEHRLPEDCDQDSLLALIDRLNADPMVDGILVQLPLPKHLDEQAVVARISPDKDVDGLTPISTGRLALGLPGLVPCTPLGSLMLLKDRLGDLSGKDAVVIGRSILVGKPMAQLLLAENCTVTIAHSRTKNLPEVVRRADIVVAAVGRPEMVKGDWLKPDACVIDVGINRLPPRRGAGQGPAGRRCRLCRCPAGRRRDHPGSGRGRADDHCRAAAQCPGRGAPHCGGGAGGRGALVSRP